jgi:serine/threonine protein kinase
VRLTQAVSYLHNCGVSHRDIKTDNVMVGEDGAVKLIDFGYATTVVKGETHCGTPNYMAPELFCKKNVYNPFKVDMWALGVLLYYLFEGCYPFRGYNEKELSRNISTGIFSFRKSDPSIQDVICSALWVDPVERVSADELQSMLEGRECMMCE